MKCMSQGSSEEAELYQDIETNLQHNVVPPVTGLSGVWRGRCLQFCLPLGGRWLGRGGGGVALASCAPTPPSTICFVSQKRIRNTPTLQVGEFPLNVDV
ncbi:hypothetical protein E2C01_000671 [Portunus trituberculatus]|uniref:Uncharacterized protein n=1 Tax=Portunus trituberculatus TaxID=210409 RepID=A0A5B7CI25_PORTR|nr:hypothetical protein [Portunus trituberculatus]